MDDSVEVDEVPNPNPKDVLDVFNFFDFPLEDVEVGTDKDDWNGIQLLDLPSDVNVGFYGGELQNDISKQNINFSTSYDTTCRLKQVLGTSEANSSEGDETCEIKDVKLFKTCSPVSILESSSSSCFAENPKTLLDLKFKIPMKAPRSKRSRARPSNIDRFYALPFVCQHSSATLVQPGKPIKRTAKKRKNVFYPSGLDNMRNFTLQEQQLGDTKKCTHCEVTRTPQWREGPMGPKTLCNACGVRYRSGRLFPEYRPAASPTFIPSVHSNSHKKVVEMRNKGSHSQGATNGRAAMELWCRSQAGHSVRQLIV